MTVSLVLVSHSTRLAEGVAELAEQMSQGKIAIAAAGGMPDGSLGTSTERITDALQRVYSPDGIVVLLDLGSAAMATEMALEECTEEQRQHILISSAPLVEGAVLAAVEASIGNNLQEVARAAADAVTLPKIPDS